MIKTILENIQQNRKLLGDSIRWANWQSALTLVTCLRCYENHGKIVPISSLSFWKIDAHPNCLCYYVPMRTKRVGSATDSQINGADVYLMYKKKLPDYYVSKKFAQDSGWESWKGNLDNVLPGKMIGGDVYRNADEKLPAAKGRIWYEADINYSGGFRNRDRILYSNDGLIFVSYDHYQTFHEITG